MRHDGCLQFFLYLSTWAVDLKSLSLGELRTLNKRITREVEVRERAALEELLSVPRQPQATVPVKAKRTRKAVAKKRAPLPIRYAHPGNPELKWSGRGRRPNWVELWAQNGGAMSALENAAELLGGMSQSVPSAGEAVPE